MNLITRAEWGAAPPKRAGFHPSHPVRLLILHHEGAGAPSPASREAGKARVKAIQRYHLNHPTDDYRDIAYTMLADEWAGYEGRDWRTAPGATKGHNAGSKAVSATGDWHVRTPPDALLDNLAGAAVYLWRAGAVDQPAYDGGHRDYVATQCPGDRLYAAIPEINRRAKALAQEGTDVVREYAQCVVGKTTADLEAGRVLAAAYDIALVKAVGESKIVTETGSEARGGFGFCIGSAQQLVRPEHFPDGGLVIAGKDRTGTARLIAQTLLDHPPESIDRRGKPW